MADAFTGLTNHAPSGAGRDSHRMDDDEFSTAVRSMIDDGCDYIDGFIAQQRAIATQYYRGDPFGNEEEGRSQVVMTEVRDVVQTIIPELLRIFAGTSKVVEFVPNSARTVEQAAQATDYVNHIFWNDNPGFEILHGVFKDALVRKTGIIKWRWSEDTEISEADYTSLEFEQFQQLQNEPDVEILKADPVTEKEAETDAMGAVTPAVITYDVKIRRRKPKQRVVLEAVPPEEFIVSRDTRTIDTSPMVGHRSLKTVSDLISMGYDRDDIELHLGGDDHYYLMNTEAVARNPAINSFTNEMGNPDPSQRTVIYVEAYARIDRDGDGIAELRKVCMIGVHLLHDEVVTEAPFAFFCPDPEPHMLIGQSVSDQTMDLQLIKSNIVRNTLDSLAQSINPRTWAVEGQVNLDDVLNNEVGGVIRMRQPGMAGEFTTPFVGQAAMPVLAYFDVIEAKRTGISDASKGLNPEALQSMAQPGVDATIQGAQTRIELIARLFAGNGMTRLFKGLLRMVIRHQDKPRIIRLRDKFVAMDPRFWDADLDVVPNVALGRGTDQARMQFLGLLLQKQEQIIQILGPTNPLADIAHYRETLAELCHLAGYKDESKFFGQVDVQQMQQQMAQAAQNKPPDPTVMLAQIEQAKVAQQGQKIQIEAQQKQQQMMLEHQQVMEKARLDAMVKLAVAEMTATGQFNSTLIENLISRDQAISEGQMQSEADKHAATMDALGNAVSAHITANAPQQVK